MDLLEHLTFEGHGYDAAVLWKGNQIAIWDGDNTMLLCVSHEDFDNGEIPEEERHEILDNLESIVAAIRETGYTVYWEG